MKQLLLVFIGSGFGGCFRYGISLFFRENSLLTGFPWNTLAANFLACILAGYLSSKINLSESLKLLCMVGFCGGFSTFSAFSMECLHMVRQGIWLSACIYVAISLLSGLAGVWIFMRSA